jgi:CDP-glycerol glycerophosphotransferase (TagB/SpsB family)
MSEKPVILFESYPDFSGSPLEIYNELVKRGYDKKYDLIWAVYSTFNEKTNYKIIKFHGCNTPEKNNVLRRTKVIIDSNRYIKKPRPDVYRIHVRHGSCLKNSINYNRDIGPVDAILTTSKEMLKCDQKIFPQAIKDKFIITGYPATDKIFSPHNLYNCGFIKEITGNDNHFAKIISWLPTYRQHRFSPNSGSKKIFPHGLPLIKNPVEFDKLNEVLKTNNILLLIHPHHAQAKNYKQLADTSNIKFVNEHIKLKYNLANTDILGNSDALITDYSAAYHEYIILNRPIALAIEDLVEYSKSCGFFVNYLDWIKGDYLLTTDDLENWVTDIAKGIDKSKSEREKALHKIHDNIDNKATERVVEYIIKNAKI